MDIGYLNGKLRYGYRSAVNTDGSCFACLSVADSSVFREIEKCHFLRRGKNKRTPTRRSQVRFFPILKTPAHVCGLIKNGYSKKQSRFRNKEEYSILSITSRNNYADILRTEYPDCICICIYKVAE